MREEVLRMTHVTYRDQGGTPLRDFNLNIFAGEIMGLIPLNGGHGMTALTELRRRNLPLQGGSIYYQEGLPPVLETAGLSGGAVEDLTFSVVPGECVVPQDLQNRIFQDLVELFTGKLPIEKGSVFLDGAPYHPGRSRQIAIIGERPDRSMIFSQLSYLDNLGITLDHRLPELWLSRRVQQGLRQECAEKLGAELFDLPPDKLSTQQKYDLVYQRILLQNPKVVFCIQPFQGVDLEMCIHIWKLLDQVMEKGIALVILAINLADSLSLASRLIRIRQGSSPEVYEQSEFAHIPFNAPWLDLYRGG